MTGRYQSWYGVNKMFFDLAKCARRQTILRFLKRPCRRHPEASLAIGYKLPCKQNITGKNEANSIKSPR